MEIRNVAIIAHVDHPTSPFRGYAGRDEAKQDFFS